jgi:hypothetical protein
VLFLVERVGDGFQVMSSVKGVSKFLVGAEHRPARTSSIYLYMGCIDKEKIIGKYVALAHSVG